MRPLAHLAALAGLAFAACAAGPTAALDRVQFEWRSEPDGESHALMVAGDGSALLCSRLRAGDEPLDLPEVEFGPSAERAAALATARAAVATMPRWQHVSATASGVRVRWLEQGRLRHESFLAIAPALAEFAATLAATDDVLAAALRPLLRAERRAPTFAFTPGDDPVPLAAILGGNGTDVPLRHLAARIAIDECAYVLVPRLQPMFAQSLRSDGQGDYFLAAALLRLGAPDGVARVVDIAQSAHPEWADEARGDLAAAFGRDVLGGVDANAGDGAGARTFLAWFAAHRRELHFVPASGRYELAPADR